MDHEFVDLWCAYYDDLKDHVAQFTPDWARRDLPGVDAEDIAARRALLRQAPSAAPSSGASPSTRRSTPSSCARR